MCHLVGAQPDAAANARMQFTFGWFDAFPLAGATRFGQ
jgi:hypothetical protein